jgi:hypothetical protein
MVGVCAAALSSHRLRVERRLGVRIEAVGTVVVEFGFEIVCRVRGATRGLGNGCSGLADLQSLPTSDFIHRARGKIGVREVPA